MKTKGIVMKALALSLGLIFIFSVLGYAVMSNRTGYNREADSNTMETYKDVLLSDDVNGRGSRYAGRVWADKTVQTHSDNSTDGDSSLSLKEADDGLEGSVGYNSDFLHVFSTLGSSQVVDQYASKPIDIILLLDISSSMTNKTGNTLDQSDALHQVINETNTLIDQLMGNDPELPVHPQNRVGVVVYGGGTQQLLPLGHYEASNKKMLNNKQIGEYIKIIESKADSRTNPNGWVERGADTYFPTVTTNVVPNQTLAQQNTSKVMIADSTYLQGALYQGMNMLANEPETTYQDKVQGKVARTPVMITLTDGATNIVSATTTSRADHDKEYSWYNPFIGVIPNAGGNTIYAAGGANPFYADCNQGTGNGPIPDSKGNISERNTKENKDIEVQAISTRSVSNLLLAGYYKNKIESHYNTDMINYSIGYNVNENVSGVGVFGSEQLMATLNPQEYFNTSREFSTKMNDGQKQLAKAEVDTTRTTLMNYVNNQQRAQMRFPRDSGQTYVYVGSGLWSNFIWDHPADTQNDLKSFDDVYYVNKYYEADDTEEVSKVFEEILQLITSQTFTPIGGKNDNGVENSLTYMDPIGEYMDVKENCITTSKGKTDMAMLLFGEMHGMVKTAVYDYKFNSDENHLIQTKEQEGWYDNETGEFLGAGENDSNWDEATYRVCDETTRDYVSTLNEDEITPQQENTIYTLYRFTEDSTERNKDRLNPSYDEKENITYKLSDIRVWTQYTGDYIDEEGSGSAVDLGYDEALYVNIPASALPLQVAKISLDQNGKVVEGGYESNLNDKSASTPFRLFYGVGIQDAIRTEDGTKIDITKLSPEYIEKHTEHTEKGDYIYFNSNYWSGSLHTHSSGEEEAIESIGDANFSFSPNSTNRYYAFQKPLILYEDPNQDPEQSHEDVLELKNANYENFKSGLKTVSDISQLGSNKYYFIEGEYYVPTDENGNAEETHILASRKGSEFGSEIPGAEIRRILRVV